MPLYALTGGIAAGKSTVAAEFTKRGALVIDADQIVRDLQQPGTAVFDAIVERFGAEVVASDGMLDRPALGARVFGDEDALADLNAIVHPAVRKESRRRIEAALVDPATLVIYDIPLLVETSRVGEWEGVILADAPAALREQRLIELRGMSPQEAHARVASQASDAERRAIADYIIDTSGTLAQTRREVAELIDQLRAHRP